MFGVSFPELLLVFVLVLIVFGPEKLPEIASTLGKTFASLRKNSDMIRREFYNSVYTPTEELKKSIQESARELTTLTPEQEASLLKPDPDCPDSRPAEESNEPSTDVDADPEQEPIEGEKDDKQ